MSQFETKLWEKWASLLGLKPIFIFKASLQFLNEKRLLPEFEIYIKKILEKNK